MPLIIPSNSITGGGYEVANSLRFNSGSTDYLTKASVSPTLNSKGTFSCWHKRSNLGGSQTLFSGGTNINVTSGTKDMRVYITSDYLEFYQDDYNVTGNNTIRFANNLLRDVSAWYHIVVAVDTGQGTNANKVKAYINGTQLTSTTLILGESFTNIFFNTSGLYQHIGTYNYDSSVNRLDGYMSEVCFIDGQQLDPTSFGEFDEDSGIWKPIDVSGLTFGTNGFYLPFENSGALGQDDSGNGNNFTVNNLTSIDQTTDTPTNNFATWNPLEPYSASTFSNGNLTIVSNTGNSRNDNSTLGVSQGKWYWEIKYVATSGSANWFGVGAIADQNNYEILGDTANGFSYYGHTGVVRKNGSTVATLSTFAPNDIIGVALDLDNNLVYFYKNGTVQNSGTGISIPSASSTPLGNWFPAVADWYNLESYTSSANFGNPPFTISSGNADGNGRGLFEYAVPSGYYALNTKNLAEFG